MEATEEDRLNGNKNYWPFLGAILLTTANIDWILYPLVFEPLIRSFWLRFWITTILANLEIVGWFYFWRWFAWSWLPKTEKVRDTIDLTKGIIEELKERGLWGTIQSRARQTFRWATNPTSRYVKFIKAGSHFAIFLLGAEPFFTGGRLFAVVFCATTRWKNGLYALCLGNAVHVYITMISWDLTFYLWDEYRGVFMVAVSVVVFLYILYLRYWPSKKT